MVTLAVLRKNKTTSTMETSVEERPRKRQCRRVRFSDEEPRTLTFNNFAEAKTEQERKEICKRVWYTREEFDAFLEDRVHTIRMWRAVEGNTRLIEPYYCIRGLEMYESAQLNGDVLAARAGYIQSVLQEQNRQRQEQGHKELDWGELAKAVAQRSVWAMRQASRLAFKDALEAQEVFETDASDISLSDNPASLDSFKRLSMPFGSQPSSLSCSRRLSLPTSSLYNNTTATRHRAPVDVYKLKEMNRQFLKSMTAQQQSCGGSAHNKVQSTSLPHSNSLALMLVRGRRLAMQNSSNNNNSNRNHHRNHMMNHPLPSEAPLQLGHGLRRDSLHGLIRDTTKDL